MQQSRQLLETARRLCSLRALQQADSAGSRWLSSGPGKLDEYSNYYKSSDAISTRAQQEQVADRAEPAATAASSSQPEQSSPATDSRGDLQRGGARTASAWLFPWEKRQMDGSGPLRTWEKIYWGGFVTAIALLLFNRLNSRAATSTSDPQAAEKLEAKRMDAARMILAGRSFTEGLDAFEGLSPPQIQEYVSKASGGATSKDPYEGMSPEEINAYLEQQEPAPL